MIDARQRLVGHLPGTVLNEFLKWTARHKRIDQGAAHGFSGPLQAVQREATIYLGFFEVRDARL
jgi:hypothetical protein